MENIYAIWIHRVYAFLFPPSTEMKGLWYPEPKLCFCLFLSSIFKEISWSCLGRQAQEGGREKERTCLYLNGYSVLWKLFSPMFSISEEGVLLFRVPVKNLLTSLLWQHTVSCSHGCCVQILLSTYLDLKWVTLVGVNSERVAFIIKICTALPLRPSLCVIQKFSRGRSLVQRNCKIKAKLEGNVQWRGWISGSRLCFARNTSVEMYIKSSRGFCFKL